MSFNGSARAADSFPVDSFQSGGFGGRSLGSGDIKAKRSEGRRSYEAASGQPN